MTHRLQTELLCGLTIGLAVVAAAGAAPALTEDYEGPDTSWRLPADPGGTRLVDQRRVRTERQGAETGAEWVRFACPTGYSAVLLHPVGHAPVLDEFAASVAFLGGASGAQLGVRVVFPNQGDPNRGDPDRSGPNQSNRGQGGVTTTIVRGEARYESPGRWSRLTVEGLPLLVKRHARVLRAENAAAIDERGAYVDAIVLIVPGGPHGTEFWTDDLTVSGVVTPTKPAGDGADSLVAAAGGVEAGEGAEHEPPAEVLVDSRGFAIDGEGWMPRILQSRGESPKAIRRLGFNALAPQRFPDRGALCDARDASVLLLCPPPGDGDLDRLHDPRALNAIAAWTLAGSTTSIDSARPQIDRLREHELLAGRPLLALARDELKAWSRLSDAVVIEARAAAVEGALAAARSRALPGTPLIARLTLTHDGQALDQLRAFAPTGKARPWREPDDIEAAVWSAVAAGAKGVWLAASEPLTAADAATEKTAAAVELLNLKLALVEPWLVGGEPAGEVLGRDRRVLARVFRRGRARVVIGIGATQTAGANRPTELIIPGVSETAAAYEMTPAGLSPLESRRTIGGVSVGAGALEPGALLLLTDDRLAVRDIRRRITASARRAVELQQALAVAELIEWETVLGELTRLRPDRPPPSVAPAVKRLVSRSKTAQSGSDLPGAYLAATRARDLLRSARASVGSRLLPGGQLTSSPLVRHASTWADQLRLEVLLRGLPRSGNLLAGGDFEDLDALRGQGWRYTRLDRPGGDAEVALSDDAPRHGARSLTLRGESPRASAWVTSPPTPLNAGQLVEITGWVRVWPSASGSGRLTIVDSLGGDELAITVGETTGWRPFRMLRRPTRGGPLSLAVVLNGEATASIDAVMIRPIHLDQPIQLDGPRQTATRAAERGVQAK